VQTADEAVHIGRSEPTESYLNIDKLIAVAKDCGAEVFFHFSCMTGLSICGREDTVNLCVMYKRVSYVVGRSPRIWIFVREREFFGGLREKRHHLHRFVSVHLEMTEFG
jgi:hypothetical protein